MFILGRHISANKKSDLVWSLKQTLCALWMSSPEWNTDMENGFTLWAVEFTFPYGTSLRTQTECIGWRRRRIPEAISDYHSKVWDTFFSNRSFTSLYRKFVSRVLSLHPRPVRCILFGIRPRKCDDAWKYVRFQFYLMVNPSLYDYIIW